MIYSGLILSNTASDNPFVTGAAPQNTVFTVWQSSLDTSGDFAMYTKIGGGTIIAVT